MSRVAPITGATSGIGAAIANAFHAAGYRVAATFAFTEARAAQFRPATGIPAYCWDIRDSDAGVAGIAQVEKDIAPVAILVNNAGITRDAMLHKITPLQGRDVIDTNLTGAFNMT